MVTPSQEELRHSSTKEDQPEQFEEHCQGRGWLSPANRCQNSCIWLADLQGDLFARSQRSVHRHHPIRSWYGNESSLGHPRGLGCSSRYPLEPDHYRRHPRGWVTATPPSGVGFSAIATSKAEGSSVNLHVSRAILTNVLTSKTAFQSR
jgi:hypothetical protein